MKKKVLFIGTTFFGIQKEIISSLVKKGFNVDFFAMFENNNTLLDGIYLVYRNLEERSQREYYNKIWSEIKSNRYQYIFVIKGDSIPGFFMKNVRYKNKNAKFILYLWDSVKNMKGRPNSIYYDDIYTFDRIDSVKYQFKHLPLFYFHHHSERETKREYLVSFLATLHTDRLFYAKYFSNLLSVYSQPSMIYIYAPIKSLLKHFLMGRIGCGSRLITTKKLSLKSVNNITLMSGIILDFPHGEQSGLTLRLMSAIGVNSYIITTSTDIVNYDFYNKDYILVIDKKNLNEDKIKHFICQSVGKKANYLNTENYYLPNWLDEFF